jgi:hypothetical protein
LLVACRLRDCLSILLPTVSQTGRTMIDATRQRASVQFGTSRREIKIHKNILH